MPRSPNTTQHATWANVAGSSFVLATLVALAPLACSETSASSSPSDAPSPECGVAAPTDEAAPVANKPGSPECLPGDAGSAVDGAATGDGSAPPPDVDDPDLTPALTVEYVDTAGTRQRTAVVDGATTITGVAPFLVTFDATGTRSVVPGGNDADGAWLRLGYRIHYGEGLGGTWPVSGQSRDEDTGPPIFGRAFTRVGTNVVRLRARDSAGNESTIAVNVVVTAPPTAVHLPVSRGAWPAWTSGTHYTLDAGGNYTSFGPIETTDRHGILISKVGAGADPVVAGVNVDARNEVAAPVVRSKNIRLRGVDVGYFTSGAVGFDYSGVVEGRLRRYTSAPYGYVFDQAVENGRGLTVADNVRYPRGFFAWSSGEMLHDPGSGYAFYGFGRAFHLVGVRLNKDGGGGGAHCMRGSFDSTSVRHSVLLNTVASTSFIKIQGNDCKLSPTPDAWRDDDRAGDYARGLSYGYPTRYMAIHRVQFGAPGQVVPVANAGFGPENADAPNYGVSPPVNAHQGVELSVYEDCVWFGSTSGTALAALEFRGRALGVRNLRYDLGAGGNVPASSGVQIARVPPGWNGPYVNETGNTRPVPSPF